MFTDATESRRATLIAGLILLIVLVAVAAFSADLNARSTGKAFVALQTRQSVAAVMDRLTLAAQGGAGERLIDSLVPIEVSISGSFPGDALLAYDIGMTPDAAVELVESFLESALPDLHRRLVDLFEDFSAATGLDPDTDFLPYLDHGLAVALLPPESGIDEWPFPRKVVVAKIRDEAAVARFLEAWITWQAGAIAPETQGVLGASVLTEVVAGSELVGLRLDGLLPSGLPLPSPSYALAGDYLIASPVRSAVRETLNRFDHGLAPTPVVLREDAVVEVVWLNFPEWPRAWLRAEPFLARVVDRLGGDSRTIVEICGALIEYLGEFQPAHGTTTLTPDGGLVFRLELAPIRRPSEGS